MRESEFDFKMSAQLQTQPKVELPAPAQPALRPARTPILQRKCACGGSSGSSGSTGGCDDCKKDTATVQRFPADRSAWSILLGPARGSGKAESTPAGYGPIKSAHSFAQVSVRNNAPISGRRKRVIDEMGDGYGNGEGADYPSEQGSVLTEHSTVKAAAPSAGETANAVEQV